MEERSARSGRRRGSGRAAFVSMCLLSGLLTGLPGASAAASVVVVRGATSGMGTLTLPTAVRVDPDHATVVTKGRFAGIWLLDPHTGQPVTGVFHLSFHRGDPDQTVSLSIPRTLRPGTYGFALFTDGPATITIPMRGLGRALSVSPDQPLGVRSRMVDAQPMPGSPAGFARLPVRFGAGDFAVLGTYDRGTAQQATYQEMCLAKMGEETCAVGSAPGGSTYGLFPGNTSMGDGFIETLVFLYQDLQKIPPSRYDALFRMGDAGISNQMTTFALTVDLPPS